MPVELTSLRNQIVQSTSATEVEFEDLVQELWSGYGEIRRVRLHGHNCPRAVLKLICPPQRPAHPRGWNTHESHKRKVKSYEVEAQWYAACSALCDDTCKVPALLASGENAGTRWLLLEDLSEDYPSLRQTLDLNEVRQCLEWLASFHSRFMGIRHEHLWPTGTYWHLATRMDEYRAMPEGELKRHAHTIDSLLENCAHKTLVHGDAKVANFCFDERRGRVAAVDFQYVGAGAGIRDVVYFLGSCLPEQLIAENEAQLLSCYFDNLHACLQRTQYGEVSQDICAQWRFLYEIAWTDFHRFLSGWMPGHPKINDYTRSLAIRAYQRIESGRGIADATPYL